MKNVRKRGISPANPDVADGRALRAGASPSDQLNGRHTEKGRKHDAQPTWWGRLGEKRTADRRRGGCGRHDGGRTPANHSIAMLPPRPKKGHRNDGHQRRSLGRQLAKADDERQRRDKKNASANPEKTRQGARNKPERNGRDDRPRRERRMIPRGRLFENK